MTDEFTGAGDIETAANSGPEADCSEAENPEACEAGEGEALGAGVTDAEASGDVASEDGASGDAASEGAAAAAEILDAEASETGEAETDALLAGGVPVAVTQPEDGAQTVLPAVEGQVYDLQFDPRLAQVRIMDADQDGDLDVVLLFNPGTPQQSQIVFQDMVDVAQGGTPPLLQIGTQQFGADNMVQQAQALATEQPTLETAAQAGPEAEGTGATQYDDNLGTPIGLLDPQGVIPPVSMQFPSIDPEPEDVLADENDPPADFDVLTSAFYFDASQDPLPFQGGTGVPTGPGFVKIIEAGLDSQRSVDLDSDRSGSAADDDDNLRGNDPEDGPTESFFVTGLPSVGQLLFDAGSDGVVDQILDAADVAGDGFEVTPDDLLYFYVPESDFALIGGPVSFTYYTVDSSEQSSDGATYAIAFPEPTVSFDITVASEIDEGDSQLQSISEENDADDTATFTIAMSETVPLIGPVTASVTVSIDDLDLPQNPAEDADFEGIASIIQAIVDAATAAGIAVSAVTSESVTLTWDSNDPLSFDVVLTALDDDAVEGLEVLRLVLSDPTLDGLPGSASLADGQSEATAEITELDADVTFAISVSSETDEPGEQAADISEEDSADDTATFRIALGGDPLPDGNEASVTVTMSGDAGDADFTAAVIQSIVDAAGAAGIGVSGQTATSVTLTWDSADPLFLDVDMTAFDDDLAEPIETLVLTLSGETVTHGSASLVSGQESASASIAFDDLPDAGQPDPLVIDETAGVDSDSIEDDVDPAGAFAGLTAANQDALTGTLGLAAGFAGALSVAQQGFAFDYGQDGPGAILLDGVTAGTASGLFDSASGEEIFLFTEDGLLVGRVGSGGAADAGGDIAFVVIMEETGTASGPDNASDATTTVVQYRALVHDDPADADEASGSDAPGGADDEFLSIGYSVSDLHGDTASGQFVLSFEDDGPTISVTGTEPSLTVDETDLATDASASFAASFASAFGEDGAGSLTYALSITGGNGTASGLTDTATGNGVFLFLEAGVIVGREGTDAADAAAGDIVFTVTVDAAGLVTLDQQRAVVHPDTADPDDAVTLVSDDLVQLTATIVDADGDSASASLGIGQNLTFEDDGPTISVTGTEPSLVVDETDLATDASASFAASFTSAFGEDGAGSLTYALSITGGNGAASGLTDTATGNGVFLFLEAGVIVGREGTDAADAAAGDIVFTVTVDAAGLVTLDQQRAVVHPDTADPDDAVTLASDGLVQLTATIVDADGDSASASLAIGQNLTFEDDGPTISVTGTEPTLTVDETDLATDASESFAASFTSAFGSDGAGSLTYALSVSGGNGTASGLTDTATGNGVFLFLEAGVIVGREGTDAADAAAGDVVFTVTVDAAGLVTLDQQRAVVHPDTADPDDAVTLASDDLVQLTATIVDADGDSASASLGLGQNLTFEDDGPTISVTGTEPTLTVDETDLATDASASFAASFTSAFGEDGAGSLTYALSINGGDGTASGLTDTATGNGVFLFLEAGVIVGREGTDAADAAAGDIVFTVTVDAAGLVTLDQQRAVVHPDTADPDDAVTLASDDLVQLTATIVDADGDSASASLGIGQNLTFEDDGPTISVTGTEPSLIVDETDLATDASQSFAASFTSAFGEDGAGSLTYALSITGGNGTASGLTDTATGNGVFLFLEAGVIVGREGTDAADAAAGDVVFTVTVDAAGLVTLDQLRAVVHPDTADPDDAVTLASDDLVQLTATIVDADGDSASASLGLGQNLTFEDDGPTISVTGTEPTLTVDETDLATDASASFAASFTSAFGEDGAGSLTYALSINGGDGTASGLTDTATGNGVFLFLEAGVIVGREGTDAADAAAGDIVFTVTVDAAGLVTLDQQRAVVHPDTADPDDAVTLASDDLVQLTATIVDADGDSASASLGIGQNLTFEDDGPTISVTGTEPTLTVDETDLATDASASFAASFASAFGEDGAGSLTYALSVNGGNGAASGLTDTATGNGVFLFLEAGVIVGREGTDAADAASGDIVFTVTVDAAGLVTLDQQRAVVHPDTADPDDAVTLASDDLVQLTATIVDADGDSASASLGLGQNLTFEDDGPTISVTGTEPTLTVDETDLATDASASFAASFTSAFGEDGAGSLTYALSINGGDGTASGLTDTATGNGVFLFLEAGVIVGREGTDAADAAAGDIVFTVTVDAAGLVTLDQLRAVVHPDTADPDDAVTLASDDLVQLTATIVDADGDSASASLGLGQNLTFEDDGPTISVTGTEPTLTVDETDLATDASASFAASFTSAFGEDGAGSLTYALSINGGDGTASGLTDTATGNGVFLFLEAGVIVGREGTDAADAAAGDVVFTVTVDAAGLVTLDQLRAVVHPDTADPDDAVTLASDDLVQLTATIVDADGDSASASLGLGQNLTFEDDGPTISVTGTEPTLTVDETDLATDASASFAASFTSAFGEDGAGSLTYALSINGGDGTASGLTDTATGNGVFLFLEAGVIVGREGTDAADAAAGDIVFTVTVDAAGLVTLDQQRAVVHPDTADPDDAVTLASDDLVQLTATIVDADGDSASASLGIGQNLTFEDDGPTISVTGTEPTLTVDETDLATDASASFAASFASAFGEDGAGSLTYALSVNGGNGAASGLTDTATGNGVFLFLEAGVIVGREGTDAADAASGDIVFTVTVDAAGLVTLDQQRAVVHPDTADPDDAVTLASDDLVQLTATIVDADGDSASASLGLGQNLTFEDDGPTISVTGTEPTLTVDETDLATDASASFAASFTSAFGEDGAGSLTYALSINGGDGTASGLTDTATGNGVFLFLEAGVIVGREGTDAADAAAGDIVFTVTVDAAGLVTLDQLRAVVHPDTADPDDAVTLASDDLVQLTATIVDADGDSASASLGLGQNLTFEDDGPTISVTGTEPTLTVDETDLATDASASFAASFTSAFGEDGAGSLTYALSINGGDGTASGLTDTATGNGVFLFLEAGVIVGREGTDAADAAAGDIVFTVTVDAAGLVTLDQQRAVVHPDTADPDDAVTLASDDLVQLTATIVDADGDSASASLGIGQNLTFEDDGPTISVTGTEPTLTVDETDLATDASASFAASFASAFGEDGAGSLTYALSVNGGNGAASGLTDTATGNGVFLFLEAGVIVGREGTDAADAASGDIVFTVTVDAAGLVTLDQQRAVVHPDTADPDDAVTLASDDLVQLTATIVDADGDSASASLGLGQNLTFEDDGPTISVTGTEPTLTVDETDLATDASASFAASFTSAFGEDGAGSLTYALSINGGDGTASGLTDTATGNGVFLFLEAGVIVGREGTDAADAAAGDIVFTVTVDAAGLVTLDQQRAVVHPDTADPDDAVTLASDDLVQLTATIVDADGDSASASLGIGQNLTFEDDGPTISVTGTEPSLIVDETDLATDASASFAASFTSAFGEDGAGSLTYALSITGGNGTASGLTDTATGNGVFLFLEAGVIVGREGTDAADAAAGDVVFTVTVDAAGLVTLDQQRAVVHPDTADHDDAVTLASDDLVQLTATIVDADGDSASASLGLGQNLTFEDDGPTISVTGTEPTLTVDETDLATDASASFAASFTSAFGEDGAGSLTYALSINGGDGTASGLTDTATGNGVFLFLEAGVIVGREGTDAADAAAGDIVFTVTVDAAGLVTLDQQRAVVHPDTADPDDAVTLASDDLVQLTATIVDADGDSASASLGIGQNLTFEDDGPTISVTGTEPTLTVDETDLATDASESFAASFTSAFGSDGAGSLTYALSVSGGNGTASGLTDTATGNGVFLFLEAGVIVGREGTDAADAAAGDVVFTVTVDAAGLVTLDQQRAVVHPDTADPDDAVTLASDDLVQLTATIVDADGDSASASLGLGQNLTFEDDGPTISVTGTEPTLTVDETDLATDASASFAASFTSAFGEDGAGSLTYALSINGGDGTASGLTDTATGNGVFLFLEAGVIVGREGTDAADAAAGDIVFTVTVDAAGLVTLDQQRAVVHPDTADPDDAVTLASDDLVQLTATIVDADGDSASASLGIGQNLTFEDDGPTISVTGTEPSLIVDETDLATDASQSFAASFTSAFGEDGAGSLTYALGITGGNGAASGLTDTATGNGVFLFLEAGVIVGREGTDAADAASGDIVFTATVDEASGLVTLDQQRAVVHPDILDHDDAVTLASDDLVRLTATIVDADGDSASESLDIGQNLSFEDDGPTAADDAAETVKEGGNSIGTSAGADNLLANDDPGADGGAITSFAYDGDGVGSLETADAGETVLTNQGGFLTVNADGTWEYVSAGDIGDSPVLDGFTYTLTDGDGDSDTASLEITVNPNLLVVGSNSADTSGETDSHTVPNPNGSGSGTIQGGDGDDTLAGDPGGATPGSLNVAILVDISGSMDSIVSGSTTRLDVVKDALNQLLPVLASHSGTINLLLETFSTNSDAPLFQGELTAANVGALLTQIDNLTADGFTNYEAPLADAEDWFLDQVAQTDGFTNVGFFLSDGNPNKWLSGDGQGSVVPGGGGVGNTNTAIAQAVAAIDDMLDPNSGVLSGDDQVLLNAIGMGGATQSVLDQVDNTGGALIVDLGDPSTLSEAFLNGLAIAADVGGDVIDAGDGDDVIFADVPNTDSLAADEGLSLLAGSGWAVFEALEAGQGAATPDWDRADTVDYLRDSSNWSDLIGAGRGESDTIDAGAGNDVIFGQGGDDDITGGSGADVFVFTLAADEGEDEILDFSTAEGDVLSFTDVVDVNAPGGVDIDDVVSSFVNGGGAGAVDTLTLTSGTVIMITDVDGGLDNLQDVIDNSQINAL